MTKLTNPTVPQIGNILDEAVIDHIQENDQCIYVTGLPMNFWIQLNAEKSWLIYSTYAEFQDGVSEQAALACANGLNCDLLMIQFTADLNKDRLAGHYLIPLNEGIDRRFLLRTARMFSEIFMEAIMTEYCTVLLNTGAELIEEEINDNPPPPLLN